MQRNKMGEGGRGERSGALFIFYLLMLGDAGTYLATKITSNPHGFQAGSPVIAVRQLAPRGAQPARPGPSADCTILPAAGGAEAGLGAHLPNQRRLRSPRGGRAAAARARARARARAGARARAPNHRALFAVLIPPRGIGRDRAGRVPGICPLPKSGRECQGHGECRVGLILGEARGSLSGAGTGGVRAEPGFCSNAPHSNSSPNFWRTSLGWVGALPPPFVTITLLNLGAEVAWGEVDSTHLSTPMAVGP
jgi:hypothetical protein